jgi:pimeloyl-ACP methyl ester carboxylesterase
VTEALNKRDVWISAADGTRLYALDCGPTDSVLVPLLCLSGLTRNHRDFEPVVAEFCSTRRIITADYRGRGLSQHAADPKTYNPHVELQDALALLDHLQVPRVAVLGTSRGGIVGIVMANTVRDRMCGLMLNDVGPVLEVEGLRRIASYVGVSRKFASWEEAAQHLVKNSVGFEGVNHAQWVVAAKRIFGAKDDRPYTEHDPALAKTFPTVEALEKPLPDLWHLMPALNDMPCALLHGSGSNLLNRNIVDAMKAALPALDVTSVEGRGHVPFLDEAESVSAIGRWLGAVDDSVRL